MYIEKANMQNKFKELSKCTVKGQFLYTLSNFKNIFYQIEILKFFFMKSFSYDIWENEVR